MCVSVIKTRLQSLTRGSQEDTYSGVTDCIRWFAFHWPVWGRQVTFIRYLTKTIDLATKSLNIFPFLIYLITGRYYATKVPALSWRGRTVELSSSRRSSASLRWFTSSAWANSSWATCPNGTTNHPSHHALHQSDPRPLWQVAITEGSKRNVDQSDWLL